MASPHSPLRGYILTPVCNPESERIGFPLVIVIVVVVVVVVPVVAVVVVVVVPVVVVGPVVRPGS